MYHYTDYTDTDSDDNTDDIDGITIDNTDISVELAGRHLRSEQTRLQSGEGSLRFIMMILLSMMMILMVMLMMVTIRYSLDLIMIMTILMILMMTNCNGDNYGQPVFVIII